MRRLIVLTMLVLFPAAVSAAPGAPAAAPTGAPAKKKGRGRAAPKRAASKRPAATPNSGANDGPVDPSAAAKESPAAAVSAQAPSVPSAAAGSTPAADAAPANDAPTLASASLSPEPTGRDPVTMLLGEPLRRSNTHRYAILAGGLAGATGLAFGYWAHGETKRAQSIPNAAESRRVLDGARRTAATSTLLYGVAAASILYGLAIEFLPQKVADKASLTHHF